MFFGGGVAFEKNGEGQKLMEQVGDYWITVMLGTQTGHNEDKLFWASTFVEVKVLFIFWINNVTCGCGALR